MNRVSDMRFPIPSFVPVPNPEAMYVISVVSMIAGACLVGGAILVLFLGKGRGTKKRRRLSWIFIGVGALLILSHGVQLLFSGG